MTKVHTDWKIEDGKTFIFWGSGDNLEVGDLVYIWQDRNKSGLGEEIVYGTAEVTNVLGLNYFEAKRIA